MKKTIHPNKDIYHLIMLYVCQDTSIKVVANFPDLSRADYDLWRHMVSPMAPFTTID